MTSAPVRVDTGATAAEPAADRTVGYEPATIADLVKDLPAMPDVALRVLHQAEGDDWSVADLAVEIRRDQALTARFLRVANSAYYGARRTIGSLHQALAMLGSKKVRTTLLAASVEGMLRADRSNFGNQVLWRHASAVACASAHLARAGGTSDPEDAFIAGLLHDIGRSVLDHRYPDRYRQVVDQAAASGDPLWSAEAQVFGFDHAEVGFLVAEAWGLPDSLAETIRWHHQPETPQADPRLCATVSLANDWCVKHGLGPVTEEDRNLAEGAGALVLAWDDARLDALTTGLMTVVEGFGTSSGA